MNQTGLLRVTLDTFVHQGQATANFNNKTYLEVTNATNQAKRIYLMPSRPIEASKAANKVLEAKLQLTQKGTWTNAHTLTIKLLSAAFTENKVAWNTKPATRVDGAASITANITGVAEGTVFEIDLASIFQAAANSNWPYYGIEITTNSTASAQFFSELDTGGRGPKIKWKWTVAPIKPSNLHPANARSLTKPRFTADTQGIAVSSQQIQVATDANFSNIIRDNTISSLSQNCVDYSPGAEFTALTSNSTYFWRCRYTTPDGLTSAWSAGQQFSIKTKPTVTITSVITGETTDITPTLTHTYVAGEGGAQSKFRIELRQYDHKTGKYLSPTYNSKTKKWTNGYKSGYQAGTSYTIPQGILKTNHKYLQILDVWDGAERDDDNADSAYIRKTAIWNLMPGSTAPVDTLTVAQTTRDGQAGGLSGSPPIVKLSWTYGTSADRFRIMRRLEGISTWEIIADEITTEFTAEFGTGYEYYDVAVAGIENIYQVVPIIGTIPAQSFSLNPHFTLGTSKWVLGNYNGASSSLKVVDDVETESNKALMAVISNGGTGISDVQLMQTLPAGTSGKIYKVYIRIRCREGGTRNVKVSLINNVTPYTAYGSESFSVGSTWVKKEWTWTLTESVTPRINIYLGGDTKDVDIDYFYAEIAPIARITPKTLGWWLIAEDDTNLRIPFVLNSTNNAQVEENRIELHPLGGKFIVIRDEGTARRLSISAKIDEMEAPYIKRLDEIRRRCLDCQLVSNRGKHYKVQLTGQNENEETVKMVGHNINNVSLEMVEVE